MVIIEARDRVTGQRAVIQRAFSSAGAEWDDIKLVLVQGRITDQGAILQCPAPDPGTVGGGCIVGDHAVGNRYSRRLTEYASTRRRAATDQGETNEAGVIGQVHATIRVAAMDRCGLRSVDAAQRESLVHRHAVGCTL